MHPKQLMNQIYKYQKYIYNLTRKYYLFGRDSTIVDLQKNIHLNQLVEIGCGNGRNLFKLSKKLPYTYFLGIDLCDEMLKIGLKRIQRIQSKIKLVELDATLIKKHLSAHLATSPEIIIAFYSLSMIPDLETVISDSLELLANNGKLIIVDFTNFRQLPKILTFLLNKWMDTFHVRYRSKLENYLKQHEKTKLFQYKLKGLYFYAELSN